MTRRREFLQPGLTATFASALPLHLLAVTAQSSFPPAPVLCKVLYDTPYPGSIAAARKLMNRLVRQEERPDLTPELVSCYLRNGVSSMPFFRKTEISDKYLADLAAWLSKH